MSERVKVTSKTPESKRDNSVSQTRKPDFSQSINSPIDNILFLQRTIGNQAVQRLLKSGVIQAKLKIGQPNDIYEQEADRVADDVMRMPELRVQREAEEEELRMQPIDEDENLLRQPLQEEELQMQPVEEEELQRQTMEEEELQTKPVSEQITPTAQRQVDEEELMLPKLEKTMAQTIQHLAPEEEEQTLSPAREADGKTPEVIPDLEARIHALKGGGQPMPKSTRAFFEPRFGQDFSQVRIHNDGQAAETAKEMNAQAYTTGKDVVFGAGKYAPEMTEGKKLLAHELTHVVQQNLMNGGKLVYTNTEDSLVLRTDDELKEERIIEEQKEISRIMGSPKTILYFEYNKTELTAESKSKKLLEKAVGEIRFYLNFTFPYAPEELVPPREKRKVRILGFASKEGTYRRNKVLSQMRADQVKIWLADMGIRSDKLKAEGMGVSVLARKRKRGHRTADRKVTFVADPPIRRPPEKFFVPHELRSVEEEVEVPWEKKEEYSHLEPEVYLPAKVKIKYGQKIGDITFLGKSGGGYNVLYQSDYKIWNAAQLFSMIGQEIRKDNTGSVMRQLRSLPVISVYRIQPIEEKNPIYRQVLALIKASDFQGLLSYADRLYGETRTAIGKRPEIKQAILDSDMNYIEKAMARGLFSIR